MPEGHAGCGGLVADVTKGCLLRVLVGGQAEGVCVGRVGQPRLPDVGLQAGVTEVVVTMATDVVTMPAVEY